ncbi:MAG TPA: hypothetical protein VMU51_35735 [Mycobacteriales bacterium]|nr:hypothetical protein [Mycobacteriales bacterium]
MLPVVDGGPLWDFDLESTVVRSVERGLVLVRTDREGDTGAVLDAARGGLVRLPARPGWTVWPMALSWGGDLVVTQMSRGGSRGVMVLYSLATAAQRTCAVPGGWTHNAALSPNGRMLATTDLESDCGAAGVTLTDVDDGTQRQLWTGQGAPTALGWSPDGRHLAVSCEVDDGFSCDTTVIDVATGAAAAQFPGFVVLSSPNGCWIEKGAVVLLPFDDDSPGNFAVADVDHGSVRQYAPRPPEWAGGCHAIIGGRLIQSFWDKGLYSTALDGSNPRQLLSVAAGRAVTVADVAPNASSTRFESDQV